MTKEEFRIIKPQFSIKSHLRNHCVLVETFHQMETLLHWENCPNYRDDGLSGKHCIHISCYIWHNQLYHVSRTGIGPRGGFSSIGWIWPPIFDSVGDSSFGSAGPRCYKSGDWGFGRFFETFLLTIWIDFLPLNVCFFPAKSVIRPAGI